MRSALLIITIVEFLANKYYLRKKVVEAEVLRGCNLQNRVTIKNESWIFWTALSGILWCGEKATCVKFELNRSIFRGGGLQSKISHRANVKFNIREIGRNFKIIFLKNLSSVMIDFTWRCSLARVWIACTVLYS